MLLLLLGCDSAEMDAIPIWQRDTTPPRFYQVTVNPASSEHFAIVHGPASDYGYSSVFYRRTHPLKTWESVSFPEPLFPHYIKAVADGSIIILGGRLASAESFFARSRDGGDTWEHLPYLFSGAFYGLQANAEGSILVTLNHGLFYLQSGSDTWGQGTLVDENSKFVGGPFWGSAQTAYSNVMTVLYDANGNSRALRFELWRSTDAGATWQPTTLPSQPRHVYHGLAVDSQGRTFAGGADQLYRSDDNGRTWSSLTLPRDAGVDAGVVFSLAVVPGDVLLLGMTAGVSTDEGFNWRGVRFFRSSDAGLTWTSFDTMTNGETFEKSALYLPNGATDLRPTPFLQVDKAGYVYAYLTSYVSSGVLYRSIEPVL